MVLATKIKMNLQLNAFKAWEVDTPFLIVEGIQVRVNIHIGTVLNCETIVNQCIEYNNKDELT